MYLDTHYEMRHHSLESQQLVAVLGLPLNDVIFKLYGKTGFSLYEIEQLANLFGYSLDYPVGYRVATRAYSPSEGMGSIARG